LFISITLPSLFFAQEFQIHGLASGWFSANASRVQPGIRYIPEFTIDQQFNDNLNGNITVALHAYSTAQFVEHQQPLYNTSMKPYRLWGKVASDEFEARIGLQKINFGSAVLLRPLMWFDAIDPRDPLQMTDGVYALLMRWYFSGNSNIWLWGLYGNNERKGLEVFPSKHNSPEFGGRFQSPVGSGELGATYHHRNADMKVFSPSLRPSEEDRYALDGKWDIGIGVWFETVIIHRSISVPSLQYQRMWTIGADYTFGIGNGLNVLTEYFRTENPLSAFGSSGGPGFSAVSVSYPLSLLDRISVMVYRDWKNNDWYRLASVQRTYDSLTFYLLGFWNPQTILIPQQQSGKASFAGTGIQFMTAVNH